MPFWVQGGRHLGALLEALRGAPLRLWSASLVPKVVVKPLLTLSAWLWLPMKALSKLVFMLRPKTSKMHDRG